MKKTISSVLLILAVLAVLTTVGCQKTENGTAAAEETAAESVENKLIIYTYDSFASDWGPAGAVIPPFEEQYGIEVELKSAGDSGQVLSRVVLEKDAPQADIIIGIDNNMLAKAIAEDVLEVYKPANISNVPDHLIFDESFHVTPFDYGYFAVNYDSQSMDNPPASLEDLTKPEYADSLILMDPRTSSPGLGFLLWTISVYGDDFTDYWNRLKPSILTITDGWDSGYGLYTAGEAPMVLSYTTSPPYHVEYEETDRFKALLFEEGNYMQIEAMGIIKGAPHRSNAEKFIEYMLTDDFQEIIPLTNFMMPVSSKTQLPESFNYAPVSDTPLLLDTADIDENLDTWLDAWLEAAVE
ncbi:MAG: thiamine ABC transporter substrate binding subunit [Spirochaetales bacterium]|uniref:Thiamine ABC transporter substrate binding subunit n=1 Tax=Candidatus Thalassospirochaeta sargassi TaxID=3119039 RepID=A0AAJ1IHT6_9SPIO|nr:thiamine ABC transporter substrate binding subunit [Spirochaetales bacterium]